MSKIYGRNIQIKNEYEGAETAWRKLKKGIKTLETKTSATNECYYLFASYKTCNRETARPFVVNLLLAYRPTERTLPYNAADIIYFMLHFPPIYMPTFYCRQVILYAMYTFSVFSMNYLKLDLFVSFVRLCMCLIHVCTQYFYISKSKYLNLYSVLENKLLQIVVAWTWNNKLVT